MTIHQIRYTIEAAQWSNLDLQGHTREEFKRRNVPAVMTPHIEALRALVIAPRFARDIERRDTVVANCERRIARWNELHDAPPVVEESRTLSNGCYFGRHADCPDIFANCCECNCHLGLVN